MKKSIDGLCSEAPGITGVILAGGKSSRMGRNKALLTVNGKACIEHIADALRGVCADLLIVSDDAAPYAFLSLPVIPDRLQGSGPLAGIHSALLAIETEKALVVACDLPHLSAQFLRRLCERSGDEDVVVPVGQDGRLQPLCAIYRTSCLPSLERNLGTGQRSVLDYLKGMNVKTVIASSLLEPGADAGLFASMNTPEEYQRAALRSSQR